MEIAKHFKESAQQMQLGCAREYDVGDDVQANATEMMSQTKYSIHLSDAFTWLEAREENSIHAILLASSE